MSILNGIGELVDAWLGVSPKGSPPYYRHKSAALGLGERNAPIIGTSEFLEAVYEKIQQNWKVLSARGDSRPSRENWRWKRHTTLADSNQSKEVVLERALVLALGENWSNQVPVASGLAGPVTDKRAAIDLVRRQSPTAYEFIELKIESDNPLFAAIEILLYGLLFVWSRENQAELDYDVTVQPLLAAESVQLSVLAPAAYYEGFELTELERALSRGLEAFGSEDAIEMGFRFRSLDG